MLALKKVAEGKIDSWVRWGVWHPCSGWKVEWLLENWLSSQKYYNG